MDMKKWIPWNWFKKEEEEAGKAVPVQRSLARAENHDLSGSLARFHQDIDRFFEHTFRGFDLAPFGFNRPLLPRMNDGMIKPTLDLSATDKAYTIAVEVPGVDEKDVRVEIVNDTSFVQWASSHF